MADEPPITQKVEKDRCKAWAANSNGRCQHKRLKVFGSQYCRFHQPKKSIAITLVSTIILGLLGNWIYGTATRSAPKLELFFHRFPIKTETVIVCPSNVLSQDIELSLKNVGNTTANEMYITVEVPTFVASVIDSPEWERHLGKGLDWSMPEKTNLKYQWKGVLPPKYVAASHIMTITNRNVDLFCAASVYGASSIEPVIVRIHFVFRNPPGQTNVLYGERALEHLLSITPEAAKLRGSLLLGLNRRWAGVGAAKQ